MARIVNLSEMHLGRLAKAGDIPGPIERGVWDVIATVNGYLAYKERQAGKRDEKQGDVKSEELRLMQARRQKTEAEHEAQAMKNDLARGKLALVSDVEATWTRVTGVIRSRVLAIPSRAAPRLAALSTAAACQATLEAECAEALEEIANTHVEPFGTGGTGFSGDDSSGSVPPPA